MAEPRLIVVLTAEEETVAVWEAVNHQWSQYRSITGPESRWLELFLLQIYERLLAGLIELTHGGRWRTSQYDKAAWAHYHVDNGCFQVEGLSDENHSIKNFNVHQLFGFFLSSSKILAWPSVYISQLARILISKMLEKEKKHLKNTAQRVSTYIQYWYCNIQGKAWPYFVLFKSLYRTFL